MTLDHAEGFAISVVDARQRREDARAATKTALLAEREVVRLARMEMARERLEPLDDVEAVTRAIALARAVLASSPHRISREILDDLDDLGAHDGPPAA